METAWVQEPLVSSPGGRLQTAAAPVAGEPSGERGAGEGNAAAERQRRRCRRYPPLVIKAASRVGRRAAGLCRGIPGGQVERGARPVQVNGATRLTGPPAPAASGATVTTGSVAVMGGSRSTEPASVESVAAA